MYSNIISELKNSKIQPTIEEQEYKEEEILENNYNFEKQQNNIEYIKDNKKIVAEVVGRLNIPDINLKDKLIYEGTEPEILNIGIGHFTNTSICNGNVGLASHNSGGKGDEFKNLKNIKIGSKIYYQTKYDTKIYLVETITEISDEDWSYLAETKENKITLLTCVSGKPNNRLCVQGIEVI